MVARKQTKRLLITGANGFIGSHLAEYFKNDYEVWTITRNPNNSLPNNIAVSDIREFRWHSSNLPEHIDIVLHCAAKTFHKYCDEYPEQAFDINVNSAINLLGESLKHSSKFVFFSTGDIYGYHKNPISESEPASPIDTYSQTKLEAEKRLMQFSDDFSIQILRLFHVYGKRMASERMIPSFIRMIENGKRAYCGPDGQPLLSLTPILYLTKCVEKIMLLDISATINVAGDEILGVEEIFNLLAKKMDSSLRCELRPHQTPGNLIADRRKLLNYTNIIEADKFVSICPELIKNELVREKR